MSLKQHQISQLRQVIKAQISELEQFEELGEASSKTVVLDQSKMGRVSRIDAIQQQQMAQANQQRDNRRKLKLQSILEHLESESFGECEECGEPISFARLLIKPESNYCIECQTALEEK